MFRHFFKLIWNKKRHHALVMVEILVSFLVMFGLFSLVLYNTRNYRQPIGYEFDDVWALNMSWNEDTTNIAGKVAEVAQRVRAYPEVAQASLCGSNTPFSMSTWNSDLNYKGVSVMSEIISTDEYYPQTLGIELASGKWFTKADGAGKHIPVVLNREAATRIFGEENPLGKVIGADLAFHQEDVNQAPAKKVVGVIGNFKKSGEYQSLEPVLFQLHKASDGPLSAMLIRVKPGTDAGFEARLMKDLGNMVKGWNLELTYLEDQRKNQHRIATVPVIIFSIICGFLLLNVALGLFGVLNLNIAKRKDEIGLRRAMGATEGAITLQFVGEMWILSALAVFIGLIFAVQFPLMNVFDVAANVYAGAIALSVLSVFALVGLCALYPSREAAKIMPATALHEE